MARFTATVPIAGCPRGWQASQLLCLSLGAPEDGQNHSYCAYRWVPQRMARITATVVLAVALPLQLRMSGAADDQQNGTRKLRLQVRVSSAVAYTESAFKLGRRWRLRHRLHVNLGRMAA